MEAIIVALITGGCSIVGVIVSNVISNSKVQKTIEINQAVTNTEIKNLREEVQKHNSFATRVPVLEKEIETLKEAFKQLKEGK